MANRNTAVAGWRSASVWLFVVSVVSSLAMAGVAAADPTFSGRPTVKDGDDLCFGGTDVRLLGVDAFETQQQCRGAGGQPYPCGVRAAAELQSLIDEDTVTCTQRWGRDQYGRPLVVCTKGSRDNLVDINEKMVRSGWAVAYKRTLKKYRDAEREAEAARRGVWAFGRGSFEMPWVWRDAHLGEADNPKCAQ